MSAPETTPAKNGDGTSSRPATRHQAPSAQPMPAGTFTSRPARCQIRQPKRISGTAKPPGPAQKEILFRRASMVPIMNDQTPDPALPPVVDRKTWQEARDALFAREKAHTREGDAIAAARRRLPMVEVDAGIEVIGPDGPVTILDVFEGRKQLIAYFHAWWPGRPAAEQCEGCTFFNCQVRELSYLHSRDITYATLCKGPYEESVRYRDFMGLDMPWYSA